MGNYILLGVSVILGVVLRSGMNYSSKHILKNSSDCYKFNAMSSTMVCICFLLFSLSGTVSWYTVLLGLLFGVITNLSSICNLKALQIGPFHYSSLITTSSLIIPTLSDPLVFGKNWQPIKLCAAFLLIFFIFLTLRVSSSGTFSWKWLGFCMGAFCCSGSIGILQKIHQASPHASERTLLLAVAFAVSALVSVFFCRTTQKQNGETTSFRIIGKPLMWAGIVAFSTAATNLLNLTLSGLLPSAVFFPMVNGGGIVLALVASLVIFREKLTRRQAIGLVGCTATLLVICFL